MSGALKQVSDGGAADIDIAQLAHWIEHNRFMPAPPADTVFVGDGDYRAIGAEFLRHVVEIGGLAPDARVLDVGCGIGRLAVPLTQYLDQSGYLRRRRSGPRRHRMVRNQHQLGLSALPVSSSRPSSRDLQPHGR